MTIPQLSSNRLGLSQIDGGLKIPFQDNKLVIGVGTSPFTIADTVRFGASTALPAAMVIEKDKKICLTSDGINLNSRTDICTTFGANAVADRLITFNNGAKEYVVIGKGYYQRIIGGVTTEYTATNNKDSITLFRGSQTYGSDKLYQAFQ
jgi:hypothetical protein